MLNIIIIDDEQTAVEELEFVLSGVEEINVVGKYLDVKEGLCAIREIKPEAVFLDIDMPELNGFLVADEIKKASEATKVIFVTAHDKYAIKAFEINALDYVLKPFSEERIEKTIKRLLNNQCSEGQAVAIQEKKIRKLPVRKKDFLMLIDLEEILYCNVRDGRVFIYSKNEVYESDETLTQIEKRLEPFNFAKCHRNYLVNLELITNIIPWTNGTYLLKLKGTTEDVPVSRNYNKLIKKIFSI